MKMLVTTLMLSLLSIQALANLSPSEVAKLRFVNAQEDATRLTVREAVEAKEALQAQRYSLQGQTTAALLGGGCGFAGCDSLYFVTTEYSTMGVNPQSTVVAGVVSYSAASRSARVEKVLSQKDKNDLLEKEE